jgi:hypothetical protein
MNKSVNALKWYCLDLCDKKNYSVRGTQSFVNEMNIEG